MKRFWDKVNKEGPIPEHCPELGNCWIWTAGTTGDGYGAFWLDGRTVPAHSVALSLANIEIPKDKYPDHICRVRHCVRSTHLRALTNRENVLAGVGPSAQNARKTHCKNGHELSGANVVARRDGHRSCRTCVNAWKREKRRSAA
jgi:hypothetical protein